MGSSETMVVKRQGAGRAAHHEVADADLVAADAAADRRRDMGELEVELGLGDGRLVGLDGGDGSLRRRARVLELLLRRELLLGELAVAHEVEIGAHNLRLVALEIGLGLVEIGLEGPRVDDEEEIALLDQLPVLEMNLGEIAAHPCAHLDILDGSELPGVFVPFDDLALERVADRDGGRRRRALRQRPWRGEERERREKRGQTAMACKVQPRHARSPSGQGSIASGRGPDLSA